VDDGNSRIQEFTETDKYLTQFGSAGSGAGQFSGPMNVAFAAGDVYVTDEGNNRIDEFSTTGSFIKAMGWGVSDGKEEAETCTSSCRAGIAGAGNREFNHPRGLTTDPVSGNLYVTELGNNRVQEITTVGAFVAKFGSGGAGSEQFAAPMGVVVGSTGGIYVTDFEHARMTEWLRATWWPTSVKGALSDHTTMVYAPVENSTGETSMYPYESLSPPPTGVSCGSKSEELKIGCRALTFSYAKETTAKGEKRSEWGEYRGHLSKIFFHGYNPSSKTMEEKAVAQYSYDKQGRLRAEWDPRMESGTDCGKTCSALKTTYGYDTEGHVSALTPPGQESWAFVYGTISGDLSTGRLLKVTHAPASAKLWGGETPVNLEVPKLAGTPAAGARMSVSNGSWSNSPVVYGYQWEDCNLEGKSCTVILGATNANYTPSSSDVGHTLVAQVMAINGGGSIIASSAASGLVASKAGSYNQTIDSGYSLKAISCIPSTTDCTASDSQGKEFYTTNLSTSSTASWNSWNGPGTSPGDAVDCPASSLCLLAAGSKEGNGGNLYYATSLGGTWSEAYAPANGVDAISCTSTTFCLDGQDGYGYFRYSTSPGSTSWTLENQGTAAIKGVFCLSTSFCAIVDSKGDAHVANSTSQIESSLWKETDVDSTTALNGVACTSTSSCIAVDGAGNVLDLRIESSGTASASKHDIDGTNDLTAVTCTSSICVAVDNVGNVFVSENKGETWTNRYALGDDLTSVSCASASLCATVDTTGKVTALNPVKEPEGESLAPQPGSTIDYRVPVSGSSAPYKLGKEEVEKWGQKDKDEWEDNDPIEGTEIFPPDEPQSWPASRYTRATIDYTNGKGLTVNTVAPTGGISTTEYNELNEVVRALSPTNRVTALGEGCISIAKKECKSAEASEKLDTQTEYGLNGSEIIKATGPEHKVKLSSGTEVMARAITRNYYNEDARQAEEKNKEKYNLLTRTTDGALLTNGEEKDVRTTIMSYNGQEDLGWKLRKATSVTTDPAGLDLVHTTAYNKTTGYVVEAKSPGGTVETVYPPVYSSELGGGELDEPIGTAIDASGDLWVDDNDNNRLVEFSPSGTVIGTYGSHGSGEDELNNPLGLAIDPTSGDVVVSDTGNNRIEVFGPTGKFVREFGGFGAGNGKLNDPNALTVDSTGNIWVADRGNNRVEEFSSTGAYLSQFGREGTGNGEFLGPDAVAISEGELYVVDSGNDRVEEFTTSGTFLASFGSEGTGLGQMKEPRGIAVDPMSGNLYVSDSGNDRIEEFSPAGKPLTEFGSLGADPDEFDAPVGLSLNNTGHIYIADLYHSHIDEWQLPEAGGARVTYSSQFGSSGSGEGQFSSPAKAAIDGSGDVWVTDYGNGRVEKFSPTGKFLASYGSEGSGNDQFKEPTAIDINKSTGDVYIFDHGNERLEELEPNGKFLRIIGSPGHEPGQLSRGWGLKIDPSGNVWVADSANNRIEEFSATGTFIAAYGSEGTGNGQFKHPEDIAFAGGNMYITDFGNDRIQELSMTGTYIRQFGMYGEGDGQFNDPEGIAVDGAGNLYVADNGNDRIQEFNETGGFEATFGGKGSGEGHFSNPIGIAINDAGDLYTTDGTLDTVQIWAPINQAAHNTQTIYYSSEANSQYPNCGNHPEWANLPCQTQLAAQPDRGLPELPITSFTYNIWDEPEIVTETFGGGAGAVKREKIQAYDPAGRALTSEEKATPSTDTTLPKVTVEYNTETGALEKQSATVAEKTKILTAKDNTLGQLVEYTDAEGNVAKYTYEEGSDGRLETMTEGKGKEAENQQTYSYDPTTGFMTKLIDSAAGTFTASYNLEGKMTSEIYPNGMCANTSYNSIGSAINIEYIKTRNCSESGAPVWFSDSIVSSIHGETLQQTSTLSKENYAYDNAERLSETQETPTGKGCVTRLYEYDEESNRTNATTREPGTEGKCASEGGATQHHAYDEANRLTDEGVGYETFGNITKMAAVDAGGHEIKSSYYVDNQIATQEQNKILDSYVYDPDGRTMEGSVENTESKTKRTIISHYAGPGGVTWISEGTEKWTRNISGIDGSLDAVQTSGTAPVLQLHDLQGNIIGTASLSESETKLLSTYNSIEFGVPQPGTAPPKYAWLGAVGVSSEPSQAAGLATESGSSYVPQVARALQTAPVIPPGAFPNGQPGTQYVPTISAGALASAAAEATRIFNATEAERQEAKQKEEEEQLRQCQEEGGCGTEGSGEETFGDAFHCYVSGTTTVSGNQGSINGYGGCNQGLPEGTWLYVCIGAESDAGVRTAGGCSHITIEHHRSRHWAIALGRPLHCEPNEIVRALVEFYVPGGKVLYAGTENGGECGGSSDGVDEAALELFGSPDSGDSLAFLISFFEEE
jgi:tripartite motif-containing protein 71